MDLSTFKTLIYNQLENSEATFVSVIDQLIKVTERDIYIKLGKSTLPRFGVNAESVGAPVLTSGVPTFEIANALDIESFSVAASISYAAPVSWRHLLKRTKEWLREAYPPGTTGRPKYYCTDDNDTTSDNADSIVIRVAPMWEIKHRAKTTLNSFVSTRRGGSHW